MLFGLFTKLCMLDATQVNIKYLNKNRCYVICKILLYSIPGKVLQRKEF